MLVLFIEWGGHLLTMTSVAGWYQALEKPSWNPPSWLFAPVWTVLYIAIAVSGWLVFVKVRSCAKKQVAFVLYGLQLFCNLLWSFFFFFLKSPGLAFVDILVLVLLVFVNMIAFAKLYRPSAILLIPYFIWILYATALNLAIWRLNG